MDSRRMWIRIASIIAVLGALAILGLSIYSAVDLHHKRFGHRTHPALARRNLFDHSAGLPPPFNTPECERVYAAYWDSTPEYFRAEEQVVTTAIAARECQLSIPFDQEKGKQTLSALRSMLSFEATLDLLKNPRELSPEWPNHGVDIMKGLDDIETKVLNDLISSQAEFDLAVFDLINKASDGHLTFSTKITNAIVFLHPYTAEAVSVDGILPPKVIVKPRELPSSLSQPGQPQDNDNAQKLPLITKINGEDAAVVITNSATGFQDLDAKFNEGLSIGGQLRYHGPQTVMGLEDGSIQILDNQAVISKRVMKGPPNAQMMMKPVQDIAKTNDITPVAETPGKVAIAYSVSEKGLEDTAVLRIFNFAEVGDAPGEPHYKIGIQKALQKALKAFKDDRKRKFIIDLRNNGGGRVDFMWVVMRYLFKGIDTHENINFRAQDSLTTLGMAITEYEQSEVPKGLDTQPGNGLQYFDFGSFKRLGGGNFQSWKEYFGPVMHFGANFTNTADLDKERNYDDDASILGGRLSYVRPPFPPSNIVVLTDGLCSSACAWFVYWLKSRVGIKSVVLGGRPQKGPMQAVGGTKGGAVLESQTLLNLTATFLRTSKNRPVIDRLRKLKEQLTFLKEQGVRVRVNLHNNMRSRKEIIDAADDLELEQKTNIPLQFVYEAADCRLFYTQDMLKNDTEIWKAVADATWVSQRCVAGSTGHPSSKKPVKNVKAASEEHPDSPW